MGARRSGQIRVAARGSRLPWVVAGTVLALPAMAAAQGLDFGAQDRANSAENMIVLAVQQGINSLPPTSGQSFTYSYDPEISAFAPTEWLGPTAFRSPQTIGKNRFGLRLATSYFVLEDDFGPVEYLVDGPLAEEFAGQGESLLTRLGSKIKTKVNLVNLSASYGILDNLEVSLSLPIVVTNTDGSEVFLEDPFFSPGQVTAVPANVDPSDLTEPCPEGQLTGSCFIDEALAIGREDPNDPVALVYGQQDFSDLQDVSFADGTNVGVGRISLGTRVSHSFGERVQVAFMPELFFPSPNEDELAGPDSTAILPRAVGAVKLFERSDIHVASSLYADVGYQYDFSDDTLSRFTWNTGVSLSRRAITLDFGVGGSEYADGIEFTPRTANFEDNQGRVNTLTLIGGNELGTSFVDFLGGIKMQLAERVILTGAVDVPLNNEGFRPDALGTVAFEFLL